jgi:tetratricopeptide (TPR) repeat protein
MWFALLVMLSISDAPGAGGDVLARAKAYELAGDDAAAVALLDAAVRADPVAALPRIELGRLVLKSGSQPALAQQHLDAARALAPENPRVHYLYALAVEEQGQRPEARRSLEVALALRDDFPEARFRLAGLLFAEGDWGGAAAAYKRYLASRPGETGALLQLAAALERDGAVGRAEATLRSMLTGPARAVATRRLAELLERQGRAGEAQRLRASLGGTAPAKRPLGPSRR